MLGVKSNRESIKGKFATKLREQIAVVRTNTQADKEVKTKAVEKTK